MQTRERGRGHLLARGLSIHVSAIPRVLCKPKTGRESLLRGATKDDQALRTNPQTIPQYAASRDGYHGLSYMIVKVSLMPLQEGALSIAGSTFWRTTPDVIEYALSFPKGPTQSFKTA